MKIITTGIVFKEKPIDSKQNFVFRSLKTNSHDRNFLSFKTL
jgi:hypothetical protein